MFSLVTTLVIIQVKMAEGQMFFFSLTNMITETYQILNYTLENKKKEDLTDNRKSQTSNLGGWGWGVDHLQSKRFQSGPIKRGTTVSLEYLRLFMPLLCCEFSKISRQYNQCCVSIRTIVLETIFVV